MSRKILLTLLAFSLLVVAETAAQKYPQFKYIGFDAGVNMAGIRSSEIYDRHLRNFGMNFCVSGIYSFTEQTSVGSALAFEQKGAADNIFDINTNLNYLTLPVYMKWDFGKEPRLFLTAGIYSGWLVSAGRKGKQSSGGNVIEIRENVTDNFRSFDGGLHMSTGMMVRLYDDFDFMIAVRGSYGLMKIKTQPDHQPKNYHLNISLGYIYYIGFR